MKIPDISLAALQYATHIRDAIIAVREELQASAPTTLHLGLIGHSPVCTAITISLLRLWIGRDCIFSLLVTDDQASELLRATSAFHNNLAREILSQEKLHSRPAHANCINALLRSLVAAARNTDWGPLIPDPINHRTTHAPPRTTTLPTAPEPKGISDAAWGVP